MIGLSELGMIPDFDPDTGYLPVGEHSATWQEFVERFGWNPHRTQLLHGLRRLAAALRDGGCRLFLLDGSFVTDKELPSDFDACADYSGMSPLNLVRLRLMAGKDVMKAEYRGEVHPIGGIVDNRYDFREFFQRDADDAPKGIINLVLESVP